jgi:hypothetical protein
MAVFAHAQCELLSCSAHRHHLVRLQVLPLENYHTAALSEQRCAVTAICQVHLHAVNTLPSCAQLVGACVHCVLTATADQPHQSKLQQQ